MAALLDSNVGSSILNWKKTGKARNEKKRTCMRRTQPEVGILVWEELNQDQLVIWYAKSAMIMPWQNGMHCCDFFSNVLFRNDNAKIRKIV
jgi:hypothetical protein